MNIVFSDLEGVLVPEIWIGVAKKTGIEGLKLTTRDIPDYDVLMKKRLEIVNANNLKMDDIQNVIETMEPFEGAVEFVEWIRERAQFIILSDTFTEFAAPLMKKLNMPSIFCHTLKVDEKGSITDYVLRQNDQKRKAVNAIKGLNYKTAAFGDSYNDISMLKEADSGFFYCPPDAIAKEYPDFPVAQNYSDLKKYLNTALSI